MALLAPQDYFEFDNCSYSRSEYDLSNRLNVADCTRGLGHSWVLHRQSAGPPKSSLGGTDESQAAGEPHPGTIVRWASVWKESSPTEVVGVAVENVQVFVGV